MKGIQPAIFGVSTSLGDQLERRTHQLADHCMSAKADSCGTPVNILVAEDDCDDVLLLRRAFKRAGVSANLFFVSDGQEAIEFLQGAGAYRDRPKYPIPALLVVDLNMPGVGGMEVLEWLITRPELGCVRVVIFSSVIAPDVSQAALKLGAYRCMTKPTDPLGWTPLCLELHACAAPSPAPNALNSSSTSA